MSPSGRHIYGRWKSGADQGNVTVGRKVGEVLSMNRKKRDKEIAFRRLKCRLKAVKNYTRT